MSQQDRAMNGEPKEAKWRDVSSYSRGDKERIPNAWELCYGPMRICVHRYIGLDGWFLSCDPFARVHSLKSANIEEAKMEAWLKITAKLKETLDFLLSMEERDV